MTKLSFQCLIFVLLFANFSQFDPFLLFFLPFKRAWQLRGVQENKLEFKQTNKQKVNNN